MRFTLKLLPSLFLISSCIIVFISCTNSKENVVHDYIYKFTIDITYTDGSKELLDYESESRDGYKNFLELSSEGACIIHRGKNEYKPIICGVRKFEIKNIEKTILYK